MIEDVQGMYLFFKSSENEKYGCSENGKTAHQLSKKDKEKYIYGRRDGKRSGRLIKKKKMKENHEGNVKDTI